MSEFAALALSGLLDMVGSPDREPLRLGGHQAAYAAGMSAFTAMCALAVGRDLGLWADSARVSMVETALWINWKAMAAAQASGRANSRKGAQAEFQVLRCLDGWVALVFAPTQFDAVIALVGDPTLTQPQFQTVSGRAAHRTELFEVLGPWFAQRRVLDIYSQGQALGVPLGPVRDAADLLDDPQYLAREFITTLPHATLGELKMPRLPVLWGDRTHVRWHAPMHPSKPWSRNSTAHDVTTATVRQARDRLRPTTAGANTSAMLADLGADVIKIESPANLDLFRLVGAVDRDPGWWNRSPAFRFSNRNKRSMALDLKADEGRRLARELIAESDVVVENFRRGVLERLGLEYPALQAANPRIVLASISSQGETGPYRLHTSFGSTLDASGGLAAMTGYDGGAPLVSGSDVNYPDQVVSLLAVGLILAALRDVARTGAGTRLDISQREIVSFLVGEQIVAAGAQQHSVTARRGNTDDDVVLQDCFACVDARWIAVTVVDAASATRVLELTGPGPSLRGSLTAWCIVRSASDAAAMLAQACISAVPVMNGLDLLDATQLWGAALSSDRHGDLVKGMPYAFAGRPFAVRCAAPDLGQDTNDILRDVLGLGDADMARLQALGVTRTDV